MSREELITPEKIKKWLNESYERANEIISILEENNEDEKIQKLLIELKHHVKVLSFFY